jgi:hypothetical protein
MGKKSRSGSGMNIPDHLSESQKPFLGLKILKFFDADPDLFVPGSGTEKFGSGINIPDPQQRQNGEISLKIPKLS